MAKIKEILRNNYGEIVKIVLDDASRIDLKELFTRTEQGEIEGAFIDIDATGNKHLHIKGDGDTGNELDSLSLI